MVMSLASSDGGSSSAVYPDRRRGARHAACSHAGKAFQKSHRDRTMKSDQDRLGGVVPKISLRLRDLAPHDHSSCQSVRLSFGDFTVALLPGQQQRRSPVMGLDLSEVDAAVGGLLLPDFPRCRRRLRARSRRGEALLEEWT